jgi:hypothetical protein
MTGSAGSTSRQAITISAWQFGHPGIARPKDATSLSLVIGMALSIMQASSVPVISKYLKRELSLPEMGIIR